MQALFRLRAQCPLVLQAQIQGQPLRQSIRRIRPCQMLDDISHELSRRFQFYGTSLFHKHVLYIPFASFQ